MLDWLLHLDNILFTQINSVWSHPWMDSFFPFITDLHKTDVFKVIVPPLLLLLFISRRGFKTGIIIFIFALISVSLSDSIGTYAFKNTVQRQRPFNNPELHAIMRSPAGGFSFVSNHAANNFAFATFVSSFFPAGRILLFTIATSVGYSRIYNGVHYPSDVFVGALLGTIVGILMSLLCRKTLQKINSKEEVPS